MNSPLFDQAAIAALRGREVHDTKRVAVVDFEVHRGDGTQNAFDRRADLFHGSSQQSPFYP